MRIKRVAALCMAFIIILGSNSSAAALMRELCEYTQIKDDMYNPFSQGYYGYFPVCYENGGDLRNTGITALVKDGHTYVDMAGVCALLNIDYTGSAASGTVCAGERTIHFLKDSAQAYIQLGPCNIEYTMPVATVYQDHVLWVPAEWFFWIIGGTFCPLPDGFVAIGGPRENALDVLVQLYEDGDAFDYYSAFGLTESMLDDLDRDLRLLDVYDGVLNFELDKWAAVTYHEPASAYAGYGGMYKLITDSAYAGELMELILQESPDEAYSIADIGTDISKEIMDSYLGHLEKSFKTLSENADTETTLISYYERLAFQEGNSRFSQALGRYFNKKTIIAQKAAQSSKYCKLIGTGAKTLFAVFDFASCWKDYEQRDQYALKGAETVMDMFDSASAKPWTVEELPEGCVRAMRDKLKSYAGQTEFAFTKWFGENIGDYAGDIVTDLLGVVGTPIKAYQLGSRMLSGYTSTLDQAESFGQSLVGVVYQDAAYYACKDAIAQCFTVQNPLYFIRGEKARAKLNENALEDAFSQAYYYVKTRYVTRELALTALGSMSDDVRYQKQADLQKKELNRLRILSGTCMEDLPLPSQWEKRAAGYSDAYLQALVTPSYVHVSGSFWDMRTNKPVGNVYVEVQDNKENKISEFRSKEDGSFELYIPLSWNEASAQSLRQVLDMTPDGEFVPWELPYRNQFAYPSLEETGTLTFICSHEEYPSQIKSFSQLIMTELGERYPARELQLNAGKIILGLDYYMYIRDNLLPELGYASLDPTGTYVTYENIGSMVGWDDRSGLLSADIQDFNLDGIDDLIVTYFDPEEDYSALKAELYSVSEAGQIYKVGERIIFEDSGVGYHQVYGGVAIIDGRPYLYVESVSEAYFADGFSVGYSWYEFTDNGRFETRWQIGKEGGSSEIAYHILTRNNQGEYDKLVLQADGSYMAYAPGDTVYAEQARTWSVMEALQYGLEEMIGMEKTEGTMTIYNGNMAYPSYAQSSAVKNSFWYLCQGEGNYMRRNMEITLSEYTELKEHIDALAS